MLMDDDFTDDEDIIELVNILAPVRAPRTYRLRENHFEKWSHKEFVFRFRLPKDIVRIIVNMVSHEIANKTNW